jgi:hypothetical protein
MTAIMNAAAARIAAPAAIDRIIILKPALLYETVYPFRYMKETGAGY